MVERNDSDRVYDSASYTLCRVCDSNPCRCGKRYYGTPAENRRKDEVYWNKRFEEDSWAMPDYPEP